MIESAYICKGLYLFIQVYEATSISLQLDAKLSDIYFI